MKCPFCNTEIEDGSLYCNHCGSAMQVVPDFNLLEDDVLPSMLDSTKKRQIPLGEQKEIEKHLNKKWILFISIAVLVVLGLGFGVYHYTHTYDYFMAKGNEAYKSKDYTDAISFYHSAIKKNESYGAYLALGKAQQAGEYYDEAEATFKKAYELNPKNEEVITLLALLYEETNDFDALEEMLSLELTEEQIAIVNEYGIFAPHFSVKGGTYNDDVLVALSGKEDCLIYYTLDGTEPSSHNGTLYEEPIEISKQGTTLLSAVCVTKDGKYGVVASESYEITYIAPNDPVLSPTGGRLTKETYITITSDCEDGKIYYTWDGSVPTSNSYQYTDPILVPEGNNILSVIVLDKHGMSSSVVKGNYIYLP